MTFGTFSVLIPSTSRLVPGANRRLVARAGKVGVGVPATALLLSVTKKQANATGWGYDYPKDPYKEM